LFLNYGVLFYFDVFGYFLVITTWPFQPLLNELKSITLKNYNIQKFHPLNIVLSKKCPYQKMRFKKTLKCQIRKGNNLVLFRKPYKSICSLWSIKFENNSSLLASEICVEEIEAIF